MKNRNSNSKKVSRRDAIKDGAKIVGGLYFASSLALAKDCVSCQSPAPKTIKDWINEKLKNFRAFFSNGYYSNGYYSNGYYSNGYYSNDDLKDV